MNLTQQFASIRAFNEIAGNLDFDPNPSLELDLLLEEYKEYHEAISINDKVGVKDALADIMYVLIGTFNKHRVSINLPLIEAHLNFEGRESAVPDEVKGMWLPVHLFSYYKHALKGDSQGAVETALSHCLESLVYLIRHEDLAAEFPVILDKVCVSNMTKFPVTAEEADASVTHLTEKGERGVTATYNEEHNVFVLKNEAGKVRKAINYKEPKGL